MDTCGMALADNLRALMEQHGDNPNSLSDKTNVAQPNIWRILEGVTKDPRRSTLEPIASYYGMTVEELVKGTHGRAVAPSPQVFGVIENRGPELIAIPRVEFKPIAGDVMPVHREESPMMYFPQDTMQKMGLDRYKTFALNVPDRSMETNLFDGDIVLVNTADGIPKDGNVFAVMDDDGELLLRRVRRDNGTFYLAADSTDKARYPDKILSEHIRILGRIVIKQSTVI